MATDLRDHRSWPAPPTPPAHQTTVESHLDAARRQLQFFELTVNLCALVGGSTLYVLALVVVDHWIWPLPAAVRFVALAGLALGAGWMVARRIVPLVLLKLNPVYVARLIERTTPQLKNSLVNYLTYRPGTGRLSRFVQRALCQKAAVDLQAVPPDATVDRGRLFRALILGSLVVIAFALYAGLAPKSTWQSVRRVFAPWAPVARPTRVHIRRVTPGDTHVVFGSRLEVAAQVTGLRDDETIVLKYSTNDGQVRAASVAMQGDDGINYRASLPRELTGGIEADLVYWIEAGDSTSRHFHVTVRPEPVLVVERVRYEFPSYTNIPPKTVTGRADVRGIDGTRVTIIGRANQPVAQARFLHRAAGGQTERPFAMQVEEQHATHRFRLDARQGLHQSYRIRVKTADGAATAHPIRHDIEVVPDLPPEIEIRSPARFPVSIPANGKLRIDLRAIDPDFTLGRVAVRIRRSKDNATLLETNLLDQPRTPTPRFEGQFIVKPQQWQLQEGDEILFEALAFDNRRLPGRDDGGPNTATTGPKRIRIAAPVDTPKRKPDGNTSETSTPPEQPEKGSPQAAPAKPPRNSPRPDDQKQSAKPLDNQPPEKPASDSTSNPPPQASPQPEPDPTPNKPPADEPTESQRPATPQDQPPKDEDHAATQDGEAAPTPQPNEPRPEEPLHDGDVIEQALQLMKQEEQQEKQESPQENRQPESEQAPNQKKDQPSGQQDDSGMPPTSPPQNQSDTSSNHQQAGEQQTNQNQSDQQDQQGKEPSGSQSSQSSTNDHQDSASGGQPNQRPKSHHDTTDQGQPAAANQTQQGQKQQDQPQGKRGKPQGDQNATSRQTDQQGQQNGETSGQKSGQASAKQGSNSQGQPGGKQTTPSPSGQPEMNQPQRPSGIDRATDQGQTGANNQTQHGQRQQQQQQQQQQGKRGKPQGDQNATSRQTDQQGQQNGETSGQKSGQASAKQGSNSQGQPGGKQTTPSPSGQPEMNQPQRPSGNDRATDQGQTGANNQTQHGQRQQQQQQQQGKRGKPQGDQNATSRQTDQQGQQNGETTGQKSGQASAKQGSNSPGQPAGKQTTPSPSGQPEMNQPQRPGGIDRATDQGQTATNDRTQQGQKQNNQAQQGQKQQQQLQRGQSSDKTSSQRGMSGTQSPSGQSGSSDQEGQGGSGQKAGERAGTSQGSTAGNRENGNRPGRSSSQEPARGQGETREGAEQPGKEPQEGRGPSQKQGSGEQGRSAAEEPSRPTGQSSLGKPSTPSGEQGNPSGGQPNHQAGNGRPQAGTTSGRPSGRSEKGQGQGQSGAASGAGGYSRTPGSTGTPPPSAAAGDWTGRAPSVDPGNEDEANLEYSRRVTNMVLDYLKKQQRDPDEELLKRLRWTPEQLRAFIDRWEKLKQLESQGDEAARRKLRRVYRSLGLRPGGGGRRDERQRKDAQRGLSDTGRHAPPAPFADKFRAYKRGIAR